MSDAPTIEELAQQAQTALQEKSEEREGRQELLERLIKIRHDLNQKLTAQLGEDWDEERPDLDGLFRTMTPAIEQLRTLLSRPADYGQRDTATAKPWRTVKTESVNVLLPSMYYTTAIENALSTSSQRAIFDKLEPLLVFIRDAAEDVYVKNFNVADLREQARRLIERPDKDEWEDFIRFVFHVEFHY
jgi:hypothetical protein